MRMLEYNPTFYFGNLPQQIAKTSTKLNIQEMDEMFFLFPSEYLAWLASWFSLFPFILGNIFVRLLFKLLCLFLLLKAIQVLIKKISLKIMSKFLDVQSQSVSKWQKKV
eukprot:TRINITY_DN7310_c0_g1_i2.p1 TRINITY_DN7310_c0_g1~~TRINITY_DN7310_c0_g1_i2.p1  ORF type:complete len:109 (+),score=18.66 TRINITY_DN7310_c0_g1_i2:3-329(+)